MAGLVAPLPPLRLEAGVRGLVGGGWWPCCSHKPRGEGGRPGGGLVVLCTPKNPQGGWSGLDIGWLVGPLDPVSLKGEAWVWGQWSYCPP